jgi:tetratricopeptide (TPR) repeat protein
VLNKTANSGRSAGNAPRTAHGLGVKLTSAFLALLMLCSILLFSASRVTLETTLNPETAAQSAENTLAENTAYASQDTLGRMGEVIDTLNPKTLEDYYGLAEVQIGRGEYENALKSIDSCLSLYEGDRPALIANLWLKRGCLYAMLGDYEKAQSSLDVAIIQDPGIADAYLVKAQIDLEQEDMEEARKNLEAYEQLRPYEANVLVSLAQMDAAAGDYPSAVRRYGNVIQAGEAEPAVYYMKAVCELQLKQYEAAKTDFDAAIEKGNASPDARYYRGIALMALGNLTDAASDFTAAIEANISVQASYLNRGLCGFQLNDYEQAVADLTVAAEMDEDASLKEQATTLLEQIGK